MKIVIVGSGPSAVAAATVLVDQEFEVEMLDFGNEKENWAKELEARLQNHPVLETDLTMLKKGLEGGHQNAMSLVDQLVPVLKFAFSQGTTWDLYKKKQFGSQFTYKDVKEYLPIMGEGKNFHRSLAKGGLSNVWGAACYPFTEEDFRDWPLTKGEMDPHYSAISKLLHLDEKKDSLSDLYPVYHPKASNISLSPQSSDVLMKWSWSEKKLKDRGFVFGHSRLAVLTEDYLERSGCKYCGLCLYGCPYGSIYNSAFTVDELKKSKNFRYRAGLFLRKFRELDDGKIQLELKELKSGNIVPMECDKLFLGTGTLSTLRIVADSLKMYPTKVSILDNDMFLLPLVKMSDWTPFETDVRFTLSQLVLVIKKNFLCNENIHTQLYSYSSYTYDVFLPLVEHLPSSLRRRVKNLMYNTFIMFGYLHSKHSTRIYATVVPPGDGGLGSIDIDFKENPYRNHIIANFLKLLQRSRRELDLYPLRLGLRITDPGFSGHLCGSLPMNENPRAFQTYPDGLLHGTQSVYVVDQSTCPSLPAQNITFTAMANAHRIAAAFSKNYQKAWRHPVTVNDDRTAEKSEAAHFDQFFKQRAYNLTGWRLRIKRNVRQLEQVSRKKNYGRVLSIGCGDGLSELMIAPHSTHITAIDVSSEAIKLAKKNAAEMGIRNVDFHCLPASSLDGSQRFDTILCISFLHHVPERELLNFLSKVYSILKPGGLFYSVDPYSRGILRKIGRKVLGPNYHKYHTPGEVELDYRDLTKLLQYAGFDSVYTDFIHLSLVPAYFMFPQGPSWPFYFFYWFDGLWCMSPFKRWASEFIAIAWKNDNPSSQHSDGEDDGLSQIHSAKMKSIL